ncbi:DUF4097 family beta strand repeat-containing protein [Pontibacter lucknowensis]|uniref:Putative adhesin n=1 Tax=Pontibacter lucknowensis TaxID=1077936 RepID=A0A1N6UXR8_9BACT|nr:DUF4097 family beta strand repeat-containing protein [Pontibacter lucknowensis]SIQ70444.1 Putative adhesin [Pontibacter lucknowensis]
MKRLTLVAVAYLLLSAAPASAHERNEAHTTTVAGTVDPEETLQDKPLVYKSKLGNGKGNKVVIMMHNSDVKVIGHNSDEVVIEAASHQAPPARAAGLKPLYNQAEDNTGMGLSVAKEGNTLTVTKASRQDGKYTIRVPKNASVMYEETNWMGGDLSIADMQGEIELKLNNGNATLSNITGPVVANATSSDMVIKFSSLNQSKPSAISTVAGTVDIHLPASTKANFKLKTIQGEIYSDFDMNIARDSKSNLPRVTGGNNIDGKTNGGGVEMNLYTISGDMYIRKSK